MANGHATSSTTASAHDRNKSPGAEAKFKEICEAYEQLDKYHLSGDEFEKRRADNIAENKQKWQRRRQQRGYRKSGFRTSPGMQPPYLSYAIIGLTLAGIGLFYATEGARLRYRFIRDVYGPTVSAWFNPETNRWETPAPWDPLYGENLSSLARIKVLTAVGQESDCHGIVEGKVPRLVLAGLIGTGLMYSIYWWYISRVKVRYCGGLQSENA